jgi:hypothetical protein
MFMNSPMLNHENAYRGVIQDGTNIAILNLIERINGPHTIVVKLVEDKRDTSTAGEFVERQIVGVAVDHGSEL